MINKYSGQLKIFVDHALVGNAEDIDFIMSYLNSETNLVTTRFIDFAISLVENKAGIDQIQHYLFNGTQIQRNYACLFFNRHGEWPLVKEAFQKGLIDAIQAYSR